MWGGSIGKIGGFFVAGFLALDFFVPQIEVKGKFILGFKKEWKNILENRRESGLLVLYCIYSHAFLLSFHLRWV